MPDVRDPLRRAGGQLSGIPDVRRLLGEPWHLEAACKDEENPDLFFPEVALFRQREPRMLGLAGGLLPLLICSECPVRRECLRSALEPPAYNVRDDDKLHDPRVFGVWGGTHELDRRSVDHLPTDEAIDALERSFPARLRARIDAYRVARASLRPVPRQPGKTRTRPIRKNDRRIDELLARRVTATRPLPARARTNCGRCSRPLGWRKRRDAKWCSSACRQAAYRRAA